MEASNFIPRYLWSGSFHPTKVLGGLPGIPMTWMLFYRCFFKFFWGPAKQSLKIRQHSDPKNYGLNGFQQTIKEKLATMWMNDMPEAALEIVRTHGLQPAVELVKLDSAITRPSFQDHFFGGISNEV